MIESAEAPIESIGNKINLEPSWKSHLIQEFSKDYMKSLKIFLKTEHESNQNIFPKGSEIFKAFELTPLDQVKVIILGQDPYHQIGQAHGLCFSVKPGVTPPPSLQNIYKELIDDLNISPEKFNVTQGCLESWAKQGVLLLNAVLTVRESQAASHQGKGWELFTDQVIDVLNQEKENLVFIFWGSYAQKKGERIDPKKHKIIKSVHPSPLSAYRGFLGSKPFSRTNQYLKYHGISEIDWAAGH